MIIDTSTEAGRRLADELDNRECYFKPVRNAEDFAHLETKLASINLIVSETVRSYRGGELTDCEEVMQVVLSIQEILNE